MRLIMPSETYNVRSTRKSSSVSTASTIDLDLDSDDDDEPSQTWTQFTLKVLKHVTSIGLILLMVHLLFNYSETIIVAINQWFIDKKCGWALSFVFTMGFGVYLGFSPYGGMPSILCGVIFKESILTAVAVSYLCVNIGALVNLAWIRQLVIKHESNPCLKTILSLLFIDKIRKRQFLRRLFQTWNPIHIIIILRLPFVTSGMISYLSSFQPEFISAKQCMIANAIGFLPGSVLFALVGERIQTGTGKFIKELVTGKISGEPADRATMIKDKQWEVTAFCCVLFVVTAVYVMLFFYIRRIIKESKEAEEREIKRRNAVCAHL